MSAGDAPAFAREPEPAGKPVTLTALWWDGPPPVPGDWLGTPRGRVSYRIVEAKPQRTGGYRLRCERVRRGTEPEGAAARHRLWTWARRGGP